MALPTFSARIAFATDPYDDTPSWTDVSSDLVAFTTKRGRQHQLDRFQAGTATILLRNVGGHYWPHNTGGDHYPNVKLGKRVNIRALWSETTYDLYTGFIRKMNPVWFSDKGQIQAGVEIECADLQRNLARGKKDVDYAQEATGTRVGNVLTSAGWNATEREIDAGDETVVATGAVEINLMEHLFKVQETELSTFFIKGNGYVKYDDRGAWAGNTSQATFGTGEIPLFDPVFPFEDDLLYNEIRLTRTGGAEQKVDDSDSIDDHGIRTLVRTGLLNISDVPVLMLAYYLLARHYDIKMRIKEFTVLPQLPDYEATLWPYVLGWEMGTRVTLVWTEADVNGEYFIEGIAHSWDYREGLWRTKYQCSDAARYLYAPDQRTDTIVPTANGTKIEFDTIVGGAGSNWASVADDNDATYVKRTLIGVHPIDVFDMAALPASSATIEEVKLYWRGLILGTPMLQQRAVTLIDGTYYYGDWEDTTGAFQEFSHVWAVSPKTSSVWTFAEFAAAEFGYQSKGLFITMTSEPAVARLWLEVKNTPIW